MDGWMFNIPVTDGPGCVAATTLAFVHSSHWILMMVIELIGCITFDFDWILIGCITRTTTQRLG